MKLLKINEYSSSIAKQRPGSICEQKKIHLIRQLPRLVATRLATEKGDIQVDVVIELMRMPHLTDKGSEVCRKCWNCKKDYLILPVLRKNITTAQRSHKTLIYNLRMVLGKVCATVKLRKSYDGS